MNWKKGGWGGGSAIIDHADSAFFFSRRPELPIISWMNRLKKYRPRPDPEIAKTHQGTTILTDVKSVEVVQPLGAVVPPEQVEGPLVLHHPVVLAHPRGRPLAMDLFPHTGFCVCTRPPIASSPRDRLRRHIVRHKQDLKKKLCTYFM